MFEVGYFESVRLAEWKYSTKRSESTQTDQFQKYWCSCPPSILVGLLLGGLLGSVVLTVFVSLYLQKKVADTSSSITSILTTINTTTIANLTTTTTMSILNVNLLTNGDGETGGCPIGNNRTSPYGWGFSGPISQVSYSNDGNTSIFVDQSCSTNGPSNRGNCYFFGYQSQTASMWQTFNLGSRIDISLIDNSQIKYNLSAWIGGINTQNDSVIVFLTFSDDNNQIQGNATNLGPVFAPDRQNISSLIFQQTTGFVPVNSRTATVLVTITRYEGLQNNGDIDNIALILYQ